MLDQMNYLIYPYHINKIINYENANYSTSPYLLLKTSKQGEGYQFPSTLLPTTHLLSTNLLPSTLLSLQTSKHSINDWFVVDEERFQTQEDMSSDLGNCLSVTSPSYMTSFF